MPTIIEYTDTKEARNEYPFQIVSPTAMSQCCHTDMMPVGEKMHDGCWEFQYRRCVTCGFALRHIFRKLPDQILLAQLRKVLQHAFARNMHVV